MVERGNAMAVASDWGTANYLISWVWKLEYDIQNVRTIPHRVEKWYWCDLMPNTLSISAFLQRLAITIVSSHIRFQY